MTFWGIREREREMGERSSSTRGEGGGEWRIKKKGVFNANARGYHSDDDDKCCSFSEANGARLHIPSGRYELCVCVCARACVSVLVCQCVCVLSPPQCSSPATSPSVTPPPRYAPSLPSSYPPPPLLLPRRGAYPKDSFMRAYVVCLCLRMCVCVCVCLCV